MKKTEFRTAVRSMLKQEVDELSLDQKLAIVQQCCIEVQIAAESPRVSAGGTAPSSKSFAGLQLLLKSFNRSAPRMRLLSKLSELRRISVGGV
jgi:hypothetical protein